MPFDGLFTYSMVQEFKEKIEGGRILKIHQPYPNEIVLTIRGKGSNHKLLLSAHPTYARAQLTREQYENPLEPPLFCMILRKHLEGHFIDEIYQKDCDRIIVFQVKGKDELGDTTYKELIIEIMGRHSNIILVDQGKGVIIDCIKHISHAVNRYRAILPGQKYIWPPKQDKINPFQISEAALSQNLDFEREDIPQQMVEKIAGISPIFAREIYERCDAPKEENIPKTFVSMVADIKNRNILPTLIRGQDKDHFYMIPLQTVKGEAYHYPTLGELLDHYYFGKAERDRVKQMGGDLERWIRNEIEKLQKKITILKETIEEGEKSGKYQLFGELITANMYRLEKGMEKVSVVNYYDENQQEIEIPLDPRKTPSENAQWYFNKYQKGKKAVVAAGEQLEKTKEELFYFEGLLQQIENASPKDLEEIKEELQEGGYIKAKKDGKRKKKSSSPQDHIEKYLSTDGTTILVGKNNKQNDYLTTKLANREDIWLHTKDIPGSHVVIRHPSPTRETLLEAALLAAYFSKAKNSSSVPVDYTKIKYVKKPSGAKPGFVIYDHQQTLFVTPLVQEVTRLKNHAKESKDKEK